MSANSFVAPRKRRRNPSGYLLLNVVGWLLFGVGMTMVAMDVQPWQLVIATTPAYIHAPATRRQNDPLVAHLRRLTAASSRSRLSHATFAGFRRRVKGS